MHPYCAITTPSLHRGRTLCTVDGTGDTASVPRSQRRLTRLTRAQRLTVDRHTGPTRAPAAYTDARVSDERAVRPHT
eukprot:6899873-Prymnesium_polylepis.1